jgi:hypothetical protein
MSYCRTPVYIYSDGENIVIDGVSIPHDAIGCLFYTAKLRGETERWEKLGEACEPSGGTTPDPFERASDWRVQRVSVRRYVEVDHTGAVIRTAWKASASSKSTDYCAHGRTEAEARQRLDELTKRDGTGSSEKS